MVLQSLFPCQGQDLDNNSRSKDDDGGKDIPTVEGAKNQIEEDNKSQEGTLTKSITPCYKIAPTHEEQTSKYISDGSECTYQRNREDEKKGYEGQRGMWGHKGGKEEHACPRHKRDTASKRER